MAALATAKPEKGILGEVVRTGHPNSIEGAGEWLKEHNVIPRDSTLRSFTALGDWRRSGGETYMASGRVDYLHGNVIHNRAFVLKTVVTMVPDVKFASMMQRRQHLTMLGVPVSEWFDTYDYSVIEPLYPFGKSSFARLGLIPELERIARVIDGNGYRTLSFLDDMRSDGKGLFYVDFGFDLGDPFPGCSNKASMEVEQLKRSLEGSHRQ